MSYSKTLGLVTKHWIGDLPPEGSSVDMPFDLENFCRENDELLDLVSFSTDRKLVAEPTLLTTKDGTCEMYKVYEPPNLEPIAWFRNISDLNKFIFLLRHGNEKRGDDTSGDPGAGSPKILHLGKKQ